MTIARTPLSRLVVSIVLLILAWGAAACRQYYAGGGGPSATLITNVQLLDGTGSPSQNASVRVSGRRIAAVGDLPPAPGDQVIDGGGLTLAPGFIDTHSHADRALLAGSDALGALSQGITTVIVGLDGSSTFPLKELFAQLEGRAAGLPVNIASYVGHGTVRAQVMGRDYKRHATPAELERMKGLVASELAAGALGLSTGLEYDPGIYSDRNEVLELARVAAAAHTRYASHIRSEDRAFWDAIDEAITIGREARLPVQISHMKLAMKSLWGEGDSLIRVLDRARAAGIDVTADVYPYRYWQSGLTVLFPARDFDNRAAAEFALREVAPAEDITLTQYDANPSYAMKTLAEIARLRGSDPASTLTALIKLAEDAHAPEGTIIAASMDERDIARILAWPYTNICTDGELDGRHPRGFGSFPRVLGRYVRQEGGLSLPEAIRKMTSLAAHTVGLRERGRVMPGYYADLVLFDPRTVSDRATPQDPHSTALGIAKVWVNGSLAYVNRTVTGARSGMVIRR